MTDEGISIESMYEPQHLDKDNQDELSQIMENITNEQLYEYIRAEYKHDMKYDKINKHIIVLNLDKNDKDILSNYIDIITDK